MTGRRSGWAIPVVTLTCACALPPAASAQTLRDFDLPSQPLSRALPAFARQAGLQILAPADDLAAMTTPPLRGAYDTRDALRRLIAGSGLEIASDRDGVILLRKAATPPPQRMIDGEPALLEEVVVTALRRESAASRTPVSIVAIQGFALEERGATSLADLQPMAPGLNLTEINPGQRRLSLRGAQSAGESTVGLYLGETPVTGPNSATSDPSSITPDIDFYDADRIEVLKGPQGTLFGSGAMSGAVRVLFNSPDLADASGRIDGSVGQVEGGARGGSIHGAFNLPVVRDRFAVRLVGYDVHRPGYVDNTVLNLDDVNAVRTRGGRITVRFAPSASTTITLTGLMQDQRVEDSNLFDGANGDYRSTARARLPFPNRFSLLNAVIDQDLGFARLVASSSWYDWTATKYIDTTQSALVARANGTYCARYADILGACNATQLQNYRDYVDSILPVVGYQPMSVRSRIHEVRLDSRSDGAADWTVGAFIEDRADFSTSSTVEADPATGGLESPLHYVFQRQNGVGLVQKAVFGEFGYAIAPAFKIRLGARRYAYDKHSESQVLITSYINASVAGPRAIYDNDASGWVRRAAASYQLNPRLMLYGQYSEGFRPGGVNNTPGLDPELVVYRSDEVRNLELGAKSTARDGRLLVDVALYEVRWEDMQVAARVPNFNFIANAGAATIRGLEVEGQLSLDRGWRATWSLNLIDGRLTSAAPTGRFDVTGKVGDRIPYEPDVRLAATAEKIVALSGDLSLRSSVEATWTGQSGSSFDRNDIYYETMGRFAVVNFASFVEGSGWRLGARLSNVFGSAGRVWTASRPEYEQSTIAATPRRLELLASRRW
ncbi:TonB-dependent receptor [soil metagenome]